MAGLLAREPHFKVFPEFKEASYAKRYEILLTKLVRERLYDAACFLMSNAADGPQGLYREPAAELCFQNFHRVTDGKSNRRRQERGIKALVRASLFECSAPVGCR